MPPSPHPIFRRKTRVVIVTCPNCGAQYRLRQAPAAGARMRCAECDHRWVPGSADDEPLPLVVPTVAEPDPEPTPSPPPEEIVTEPDTDDDPEPDPRRPRILATIAAVVLGLGLAVAAAGLWAGDAATDLLAQIPGVADYLPPAGPSPLKLSVHGTVTPLPSGKRMLEATGTISNPTPAPMPVPALAATLAGPDGVALRWTIAPPVAVLPPGHSVAFSATVTGFPPNATALTVAVLR